MAQIDFMKKTRIAVLVSGGGTNLQALIDAEKSGIIKSGEIVLVIANNKDAYALERAKKECTIEWDTSHVSFDKELSVWSKIKNR